MWLEAIADDVVKEANWAAENLKKTPNGRSYLIVPRVRLEKEDAADTMAAIAAIDGVVGIRQTWYIAWHIELRTILA